MKLRIVGLAAAALLLAGIGAETARATPLATIPIGLFSSLPEEFGGPVLETAIEFSFWVDSASDPNQGVGAGFEMLHFVLTSADAGHTLVASALNMGPDFTSAAALLTNGTLNDFLSTLTGFAIAGGGGGSGTPEAGVLDLHGQTVGSVKLVVDQLTIDSPGTDPNHDGNWTDAFFTGDLIFDSEAPTAPAVPEPGMLGLLGVGLAMIGWLRRPRR